MDLFRDATVLFWISPMLAPHLDMVQASRLKLANFVWYGLLNLKEVPKLNEWLSWVGLANSSLDWPGALAQLWFVIGLFFLFFKNVAEWKDRYWLVVMTTGFVLLTDLLWSSQCLIASLEPGWFTDRTLHYVIAVGVAIGVGFPWNSYEARLSILLVELCNYNLLKLFALGAPWRVGFLLYLRGLAWSAFPICSAAFVISCDFALELEEDEKLEPFVGANDKIITDQEIQEQCSV
jgi:hypothetical protein